MRRLLLTTLLITAVTAYFLAALSTTSFAAPTEAASSKIYVIGFHFESIGGKSASFYFDIVNSISKISSDEFGYKFKIQTFPTHQEVMDAFIKNKIDGALVDSGSIIDIIESGGEVLPWATYVIAKDRKNSICVWYKKEKPVKSINDMAGKTLLMIPDNYFQYLQLRNHLYSAGIDKPLWKFFRSFTPVANTNSYYMALAKGDGDVGWGGNEAATILKALQPATKAQLSYGLCTDPVYNRGMIAMNGKTVNKQEYERSLNAFRSLLKKPLEEYGKKYPELQAPIKYVKMVKMKFILASPDEYAYELDLYKKAKKAGWVDEAKYYLAKMQEVKLGKTAELKPDMNFCKKSCASKSSDCVLKCLE